MDIIFPGKSFTNLTSLEELVMRKIEKKNCLIPSHFSFLYFSDLLIPDFHPLANNCFICGIPFKFAEGSECSMHFPPHYFSFIINIIILFIRF